MKYEVIEQNPEPKIKFGRLREEVTFIMSMPRLAFTDNMFSLQNATYNLGLYGNRHSGAFWEQGIENLLEDAIEAGYKYGLAIDYDTFYSAFHIIDLYNLMEENPDFGVMFPLQARRGNYYPMAGYFMDDFGHMVKVAKGGFVKGIVPCDTGHFGLTLIRLSELSKLKKPWFESQTNDEGNWRERHKDADVNFWIQCKKVGIEAALAEVWIGHMQLMCSWCGPESKRFETAYQNQNEVLEGSVPEWTKPKSLKLLHKKGVSEMAEQKENPKSCNLCGSEKPPINTMNPNTPGVPTKRVDLCAACVAKNPEATFVSGPGIAPPQAPESVPPITPAVPGDPSVVETKEHGPKIQDLNVEPPAPPATPEPPKGLGPVPEGVLRQKLAKHEQDHNQLLGKRQQLQAQLAQINEVIQVTRGAIAQLRDLLGNAS